MSPNNRKLVISFTGKCNNNCFFCSVNKKRNASFEKISERIKNSREREKIIFNGSEPTIQKDFFDLVCLAKKRFKIVQLDSNGRSLADLDFTKKIIRSGMGHFKISLCGHRPGLHDLITGVAGSFKETVLGINNLIKLGQKDNIILNIPVISDQNLKFANFFRLNGIIRIAKDFGIKKVQLDLINPANKIGNSIGEVARYISKARYVFLFDMLIRVKGLPHCLIPEPEGVILKSENNKNFKKLKKCITCRYYKQCDGIPRGYFNRLDERTIKPQSLPKEIMIELTSRCNFQCKFCFNRISFAKRGHGGKEMTTDYVKKVIDSIKKAGIPIVRFTGGEPMLRSDLIDLIRYAKSKKLEVRLNTNGFLIKSYNEAKRLAENIDYVLFSMHTYDSKKDEKITGVKGSFEKKLRAIKWLKKAGIKTIRVSTIATLDNIRNLEKFYELFKKLKIDKWATNRLIPLPGEKNLWGKKELSLLVEKLIKIRKDIIDKQIPLKLHIVNAVPLCALDPIKMNAVCSGARSVDGHERFVIDPRGFAKPIYYIEKNIGDPLNIKKCWNHPFMQSLRNYKNLPIECRSCLLLEKCKGGNRYCAYAEYKSYKVSDPLMSYNNIKDYQWN